MRRQKVTIYETVDHYGIKVYWCSAKRHYWWKDARSAAKCCNGWTPVNRTTKYVSSRPEDWGHWYEPDSFWNQILVPDFLTDEIARLREIHRAAHPDDLVDVPSWNWEQSSDKTQ